MPRLPLPAACTALALLAAPAQAQRIQLTTPNATLPEEFSSVRGIRELPDGRVLVSDYIDQRVVLVDLDKKSVIARVSKGGGPQEARLPTRLIPIPGDSTLLVDLGNNRLLVLDAQGRAARTIPGERPGMLGVRGVDHTGVFYFAIPGWADEQHLPNDSVRVVKWNPKGGSEDVIAVIQGDRMRSDIREPSRTPRIPTVGYAAQDAWVVSNSGVVRIVRAGDYRIETRAPGAAPALGPSNAYPTRPVSAADRTAYVRKFLATSPTSGKGENGGMGFSPQPSDEEVIQFAKGTQFAEHHPMFSAADVVAAPDGRLWVGRPSEDGQPVQYDVFDQAGRHTTLIELRAGRRVMTIGRANLYVVAENENGIQQIERYPLPR